MPRGPPADGAAFVPRRRVWSRLTDVARESGAIWGNSRAPACACTVSVAPTGTFGTPPPARQKLNDTGGNPSNTETIYDSPSVNIVCTSWARTQKAPLG